MQMFRDKRLDYDGLQVGQVIKDLRMEKGMTLEDLSEEVGKSESHLKQVEGGSRRMSLELLFSLVDVLDADANCILCIPSYKEKETSIDEQLAAMPSEQRAYLTGVFENMIQSYPVVA